MDVDGVLRMTHAEVVAEDLHVPGQDNAINPELFKRALDHSLLLLLVVFAHRQHTERNAKSVRNVLQVGVIAQYDGNFTVQLTTLVSDEQVPQAVVQFGHQDSQAFRLVAIADFPLHGEPGGQLGNSPLQDRGVCRSNKQVLIAEVNALKECVCCHVRELIGADDIAAQAIKELGCTGYHTLAVWTLQEKRGCLTRTRCSCRTGL
mmetsp:Transcript_17041/g.29138  ORF Transcript_17041/g.29138 Transcript_17041/m.29138 type:complete len:205 (-) Transcript_17041:255-869(-)